MTEQDLISRLHGRYAHNGATPQAAEWVSFSQVYDAPGSIHRRTIDFVAINCYPSKGLRVIGVEVKVDKADWRRELADPTKRQAWDGMLTEFWFCAPRNVIPREEVPEGCGLLETWGDKLRTTIHAQQKEAEPDWLFWVSVLRKAHMEPRELRRKLSNVATVLGKPVSYSDLKSLCGIVGEREYEWKIQEGAKALAQEWREEARKKHAERERILSEVLSILGCSHWHTTVEDVRSKLQELRGAHDIGLQVDSLRRIADRLEKLNGKGAS